MTIAAMIAENRRRGSRKREMERERKRERVETLDSRMNPF